MERFPQKISRIEPLNPPQENPKIWERQRFKTIFGFPKSLGRFMERVSNFFPVARGFACRMHTAGTARLARRQAIAGRREVSASRRKTEDRHLVADHQRAGVELS